MSWFRSQKPREPRQLEFADVVQKYGAVLADCKRGMGNSVPLSTLPFDKTIIKASLIEAAKQPNLPEEYLSALEVAFCSLADFQLDGGGESVFNGVDASQSTSLSSEEIQALAVRIVAGGNRESEMLKKIRDEYHLLSAEWHEAVKGRPHA